MDIESSPSLGGQREREREPAAGAWVTVEEWSGSSGSVLSRTAVLTASPTSLISNRYGSRWGRIGGRVLGAFVPEVSESEPGRCSQLSPELYDSTLSV